LPPRHCAKGGFLDATDTAATASRRGDYAPPDQQGGVAARGCGKAAASTAVAAKHQARRAMQLVEDYISMPQPCCWGLFGPVACFVLHHRFGTSTLAAAWISTLFSEDEAPRWVRRSLQGTQPFTRCMKPSGLTCSQGRWASWAVKQRLIARKRPCPRIASVSVPKKERRAKKKS